MTAPAPTQSKPARRAAPASATASTARSAPPVPRDPRARQLAFAALALLSGVAWFAGSPDFDLWPLPWLASVPIFFVVTRAATTRAAFWYALLGGTVANFGGFYWISVMLHRFADLPWVVAVPGTAVFCAYQGLTFALCGVAVRVTRRDSKLPAALVAPVVMVACELCLPVIFPFYVSITQAWVPHVIQIADLTGPLGVTALLLMVNGAAFDLLADGKRRAPVALSALGVLCAALGYGHWRIHQTDQRRAAAPHATVGLVQPNLRYDVKGPDRERYATQQLADLQDQSRRLEAAGADLIVWPESAYPYRMGGNFAADFSANNRFQVRRGFTTPLVFGAIMRLGPHGEDGPYPYNTALVLDRAGRYAGRFDKTFLLIFGEYVPLRDTFPVLKRIMPDAAGQFARGDGVHTVPFRTPDGRAWRLGPMICYEDILGGFGRALGAQHPHLLVNITNDVWFGDTSEPWEHLALSVFRAVELRTDLVRAVNTGVSAFVDAAGRVYRRTYAVDPTMTPRGPDGLLGTVALVEGGHTVYTAVGDVFAYACVLGALGLVFGLPRLRRRAAAGREARA